jgi:hypothetical protein
MASASRQRVLQSTRQWLEPLVHVLLVCGITWREFADLSKTSYVDVATKQFGKRGRPTNVSRTAVMTGLPRREVRRQREKLQAAPDSQPGYVTKACLVLASWHLDPEFLEALVAKCGGGDVRPSTLLKELTSAGAVSQRRDGKVQALMRDYIPQSMDEHLVRLWGSVIADIARTYAHNMTRSPKTAARFERAAVNDRIAAAAVPAFLQILNKEGQAFLERMDQWLTEHQVNDPSQSTGESVRLGIGLYQVQD